MIPVPLGKPIDLKIGRKTIVTMKRPELTIVPELVNGKVRIRVYDHEGIEIRHVSLTESASTQ